MDQGPKEMDGEPSLESLIEAVASRQDRAAFASLFRHFAPRVKSYLMRSGGDETLAEEVMQEAMVQIWRKAHLFDRHQAAASTWVFTIARNKRIDRLRGERRPELDPNDPSLIPDAEPRADALVEAVQNKDVLDAALKKLPQEQSDLIRLAYYDDKSHGEIASETGLPLGTVKSRIRLALSRLRQEVTQIE